jgi:hypothetical protein
LLLPRNSALHPLDDTAQYFFASLKSYLERDDGMRHALVSGHDVERWLLKTAKAAAVSKNLARGRTPLSGAFSRDSALLDMLDDPRHWPEGAGLYCTMNAGDRIGRRSLIACPRTPILGQPVSSAPVGRQPKIKRLKAASARSQVSESRGIGSIKLTLELDGWLVGCN